MFQDEAGFGKINKPKNCWAPRGVRPCVPCHHIREYRYAYGAIEPLTGDSVFLVLPWANTDCMNLFLKELSRAFPDDMLLMALEYLREYRTYFHIRQSYALSESNAYQTIKWVENTLIKDGAFSLPDRKALLKNDKAYEVVLIDVTETTIERPKMGSVNGIPERKSGTQ